MMMMVVRGNMMKLESVMCTAVIKVSNRDASAFHIISTDYPVVMCYSLQYRLSSCNVLFLA